MSKIGTLKSGYAYKYCGSRWKSTKDDSWDTIMYTPTGKETLAGRRRIDGSLCIVFEAQGCYIAQTAVSLGVA